jgi:hypothetical protein
MLATGPQAGAEGNQDQAIDRYCKCYLGLTTAFQEQRLECRDATHDQYNSSQIEALNIMDTMNCERGGTVVCTQQRRPLLAFALLTTCTTVITALPLMANVEAKSTTTTTLVASTESIDYGAKLTLTAVVSPSKATGTVTFYSGKQVIGKSALSGGTAKLSLSTLAVGSHLFEAVYGGATAYGTSTSKTVTVVVTKTKTTTELSSSGSGANVTFTAKVSPSGVTGHVLFLEGPNGRGIQLGAVSLVGGIAKLSHLPQGIPTGNQSFSAVYLGASDWVTSTSNTIHVTIQ